MNSYITIGDYEFTSCHAFQTKKSWKQLAQAATIKLHNIAGLLKAIKVGDAVEIKGGYDGDYITEFIGYVSEILPTTPVEIKCEDEMWKLKQETTSGSWKSIELKDLLKTIVPSASIDCPEITLSPFRIKENTTKSHALQILKNEYLLAAYYRDKTLFVGLPYIEKNLPEVVFHFQKNAKATDLVYKRKEDIRIKVKAISVFPNNTRIEKEFGDADGDSTTLHFYNKPESQLKALAEEQIGRMKYDGYKGTFRTLGAYPFVDHSYTMWLEDDKYPEREIGVFADMVVTDYGPSGYHRTITPGRKVVI
jgi:hypothetical protein